VFCFSLLVFLLFLGEYLLLFCVLIIFVALLCGILFCLLCFALLLFSFFCTFCPPNSSNVKGDKCIYKHYITQRVKRDKIIIITSQHVSPVCLVYFVV